MSDTDATFRDMYVKRIQQLKVLYEGTEFLNPSNPLWPQQSFDYPYGQAPEVDDLPDEEVADWNRYVQAHYLKVAFGKNPLAYQAIAYMENRFIANGFRMYPDIGKDDVVFTSMLCEGLFSKFLCELDDIDKKRFNDLINPSAGGRYFKVDTSCMEVVDYQSDDKTEHVAPAVVVVRQKPTPDGKGWLYDDQGGYEIVGIDIWTVNRSENPKPLSPPAAGTSDEKWRRAKYFVLHGCMHRINLLDHVKVHFPNDTINAITKSVLPTWHVVHQLLMPHFWLTLPVNNAVLEGPRSLINRDTWYPWNPFAAKGRDFRKLLPYSWAGNEYYHPGTKNAAFPPFEFDLDPLAAEAQSSRYRSYQRQLFESVLLWVDGVLKEVLPPFSQGGMPWQGWLEIKRWAHEISRFLNGFPDDQRICEGFDKGSSPDCNLVHAIAAVIWNASVVHSVDHSCITTMMNDDTKPMPFVMRIPFDDTAYTVGSKLGASWTNRLAGYIWTAFKMIPPSIIQNLHLEKLTELELQTALTQAPLGVDVPLCSPADVLYAKMTDSLFYAPHNSSLLYDCPYAFDPPADGSPAPSNPFPGRPWIDADQRRRIAGHRGDFQKSLDAVDAQTFADPSIPNKIGLPRVRPPDSTPKEKIGQFRKEHCIAASIQY